ncbi:NUDIX domain-containing protein [Thermodesulfobacteriota bacterium]
MTHQKIPLASPCLEPIEIFHLFILVKDRILLFQRICGIWNFLSGEIEHGESSIIAACREALEEAKFVIRLDEIKMTEYCFSGLSTKDKLIKGHTLLSILPDFCPSDLDLDTFEITDWCLVSVESAFQLLKNGFPEAKRGLDFLVKRGIVPYSA